MSEEEEALWSQAETRMDLTRARFSPVLRKPLWVLCCVLTLPRLHIQKSLLRPLQSSGLHLALCSGSLCSASFCRAAKVPRNYTQEEQSLGRIRKCQTLPPSLLHRDCQESFTNGINLNAADEKHLKEKSQDTQRSVSFLLQKAAVAPPMFLLEERLAITRTQALSAKPV